MYQNFDKYFAVINFTKNGEKFNLFNLKPQEYKAVTADDVNLDHTPSTSESITDHISGGVDDRIKFKRVRSSGSCDTKDISSFVFGGFSSRFWMLRKHINSMDEAKLKDLPFFCWECITI